MFYEYFLVLMESLEAENQIPIVKAISHCFLLAVYFVGSLYVWHLIPKFRKLSRNHPTTIRCRIISGRIVFFLMNHFFFRKFKHCLVCIVCATSPFYVAYIIPGFIPFPIQNITIIDIVSSITRNIKT